MGLSIATERREHTLVGVGVNPTFLVFTAQNMVDTLQIKDQKEFLEYDPRNPPCTCPLKVATSHFRHKT